MRIDIKGREQILNDASIMSDSTTSDRVNEDLPNESLATYFMVLNQPSSQHTIKTPFHVRLKLESGSPKTFESISVYRLNDAYSTMFKIESSLSEKSDEVIFEASSYGTYVAKIERNYGPLIIGLSCAAIFLALCGSIGVVVIKNPKYFKRFKYTACNAKRSMADTL